jgi:hypothetical protein
VGLFTITIPNSVTSIGSYALFSCSGLSNITIGNAVTSIGASAFSGCTGLTSVICNVSSPITIAANVFQNVNQGACSLTVPNASVAAYQGAAVWQNFAPIICTNPTVNTTTISTCGSYTWSVNNQTYTTSGSYTSVSGCATEILNLTITPQPTNFSSGGINYVVTSPTTVAVGANASATGAIVIPDSVTTACVTYAVTRIENLAFKSCHGLTSITVPNSVTSFGNNTFEDCKNLTSISLPNTITSIPPSTFAGCKKLANITLPNSLTFIEDYAFYDCPILSNITIPSGVTSIGGAAFLFCTGLTSVTLPNSLTSIGYTSFAFCYNLTNITIPNGVTFIDELAFWVCSGLVSITVNNPTPIYVNPNVFQSITVANVNLYVPAGSESAYMNADVWKDFYFPQPAPTASAQTFCGNKTVADLVATGTNLKWYNVATNGTALASTTAITTGTYYVSQTLNGYESPRISVAVTLNNSTSTETISACISYTWHDTLYTASNNTATWTGTNAAGCDSVVTLNLTIGNSNTGDTTAFACNSFDWYGTTYTASATPTRTFTNVSGCDSVVTLNLTIGNSNTGDTTAFAFSSFTWYGTTYTASDTLTYTLTNVSGCDSVVTLHLTVVQPQVPGTPTNLIATGLNTGGMIQFTAPTNDGGATITNYEYSIDNGSTWITPSPAINSSPLIISNGLTNCTSYQVLIRAVNIAGSGTESAAVELIPATTMDMGVNWTSQTSAANNQWQSVTYGNGLFVAVAGSGTGNRVMTSPDGITWTSRISAADKRWQSVTYGNGRFVAVTDYFITPFNHSNDEDYLSDR